MEPYGVSWGPVEPLWGSDGALWSLTEPSGALMALLWPGLLEYLTAALFLHMETGDGKHERMTNPGPLAALGYGNNGNFWKGFLAIFSLIWPSRP